MTDILAIVGMGEGNGLAIARRFGQAGFTIAMIARNEQKLKSYQAMLAADGVTSHYFLADAGDSAAITAAFSAIQTLLGDPTVLVYNAAVPRMQSVLDTSGEELVSDFRANVAGALVATQAVLPAMQAANQGTILFTGGGFALYPQPDFASLAIGKAGIRSLAMTLGMALKDQSIRVGTITICGIVGGEDLKYQPDRIAEQYWNFYANPSDDIEVVY
jgi:NADP-dependent 3-hydroxy acid dehydrogenase YdfG